MGGVRLLGNSAAARACWAARPSRSFDIVRGFSEVSSEASRSLKTPLAFPCSAVDVYLGLFLAAKTRLSDSRGSSGCSHLWAKETVAKSTTGQQPRLNHSTIDTERVRDACAGCGPD